MVTLTPPSTVIEERLTKLFPPDLLQDCARVHRVVVRDRKFDITALVWALVLGFAIVAIGVFIEGVLFTLFDWNLVTVHIIESVIVAIGFGVILYSLVR